MASAPVYRHIVLTGPPGSILLILKTVRFIYRAHRRARIMELSFPGTFVPRNLRSVELSSPRVKFTWNFRSRTLRLLFYTRNVGQSST